MAALEPDEIRRIARAAVTAIASDDILAERLVLKGGNALLLVLEVGSRASSDLDFSMEGDLEDPADIARRLEAALIDRLDSNGYLGFDFRFEPRPRKSIDATWGGYNATIKVVRRDAIPGILKDRATQLAKKKTRQSAAPGRNEPSAELSKAEELEALQRVALPLKIELSKYEYCDGKITADVDGFDCFVYSPAMIAAEKLRALCQQMREYPKQKTPTSRARDLYDIHALATGHLKVDVAVQGDLVIAMFAAKDVPVELLSNLGQYREFHRTSWDAVVQAVSERNLEGFDYYFDFVLGEVARLQAVWKSNAPA